MSVVITASPMLASVTRHHSGGKGIASLLAREESVIPPPTLSCLTEQALEFLVDPAVSLARTGLQTLPVEDGKFPPVVTYQALLFEGFEHLGYGGTPHAQ